MVINLVFIVILAETKFRQVVAVCVGMLPVLTLLVQTAAKEANMAFVKHVLLKQPFPCV
jgi:hypothetical protein